MLALTTEERMTLMREIEIVEKCIDKEAPSGKITQVTQNLSLFITLGETKRIFWSTMCPAFQQSNFYYGKYDY